jgi:hypothetical protein
MMSLLLLLVFAASIVANVEAAALPESTEAERLCAALAAFRAANATTAINNSTSSLSSTSARSTSVTSAAPPASTTATKSATSASAATFSLALFTTAEMHVKDLSEGLAVNCSLWSWSERGSVFQPCCVPFSERYTNVCTRDRPSDITQHWVERYAGEGVEHVLKLNSSTKSVEQVRLIVQAEFAAQLLNATYSAFGCAFQHPWVSVWLGSLPDALPYATGGAPSVLPPTMPPASPLDGQLPLIIGASVGGAGVCAICAAIVFLLHKRQQTATVEAATRRAEAAGVEEAGGHYGSLSGIKGANAPDNNIYAPPQVRESNAAAIYAPDQIFVHAPVQRGDTMMSAMSERMMSARSSSVGAYAASGPMLQTRESFGAYMGAPAQQPLPHEQEAAMQRQRLRQSVAVSTETTAVYDW